MTIEILSIKFCNFWWWAWKEYNISNWCILWTSKPEDLIKKESCLVGYRGIANTLMVGFFDGHLNWPDFFRQISLSCFRDFESSWGFQQGSMASLPLRVSQRIFKSDVFRSLFIAKIEMCTKNCYYSTTLPLPNFLKNTVLLKIPYFDRSVIWSKSYP